jgi:hypothetical protein
LNPFHGKNNLPPLDECPLSLGSLESEMTDAIDEFNEPLERDNSFAMSSNVLGVVNFSFKKLLRLNYSSHIPKHSIESWEKYSGNMIV